VYVMRFFARPLGVFFFSCGSTYYHHHPLVLQTSSVDA
jgi:hypothetical protein